MKYAVNDEGVRALKEMSQKIIECAESIKNSADELSSVADENSAVLGPHQESISSILQEIREAEQISAEPIAVISETLKNISEKYQAIIDDDPFAVMTESQEKECLIGAGAQANQTSCNIEGGKGPGVQDAFGMKPDRSEPRNLSASQYGFTDDGEGNQVYDSPDVIGQYLYASQGSAYTNIQGTCGLCSCANVLRLAGVNLGEKDMIDYAMETKSKGIPFSRLCTFSPTSASASGGTSPRARKKILEHFGVPSETVPVEMKDGMATQAAIDTIAEHVAQGKGVIISVHAGVLYGGASIKGDYHAVTVVSVTKNKYGDVAGFHICDSNRGTVFIPAVRLQSALTGNDMNVTKTHIR